MIDNFEEKLRLKLNSEMAKLRLLDGYKNNPAIDNSISSLDNNKYWICGTINGMRLALSWFHILSKKENKNV